MLKFLFFAILLIFIHRSGIPVSANDNQFKILETEDAIIHFPPRLDNIAQQIGRIYPPVKMELEQTLHLPVSFKPNIFIMNDRKRFRDTFGSDMVVAVAIPAQNLMVIDYTRMVDNPFRLRSTLKHELSHLVLHHHIDSNILPRWLDEGVSQWVTGGISELATDPGWSVLESAAMRDNLYRFDELVSFPSGRSETMLAYQQSLSFIENIVDVYGERALIEVLHEMRHGASADRAFATVLPHTLRQVEYNWVNHIQAQVSWFTYISRNMFQFLFLIAAILVIVAFIKAILQRRGQSEEEDEYDDLPSDQR